MEHKDETAISLAHEQPLDTRWVFGGLVALVSAVGLVFWLSGLELAPSRLDKFFETLAKPAILICIFLCLGLAQSVPSRHPHLVIATLLFALNWAILIPYYDAQGGASFFLPGLGGYLTLFAGIILRGAADESQGLKRASAPLKVAPALLAAIILPNEGLIDKMFGFFGSTLGTAKNQEVYGTAVTLLAFIFLGSGLWPYCRTRLGKAMLVLVLYLYGVLNAGHTAWFCRFEKEMPWVFLAGFEVFKLALTTTYCSILGRHLFEEAHQVPFSFNRLLVIILIRLGLRQSKSAPPSATPQ